MSSEHRVSGFSSPKFQNPSTILQTWSSLSQQSPTPSINSLWACSCCVTHHDQKQPGRNEFISLKLPMHRSLLKSVMVGAQTGQEPGADWEVVEECLLTVLISMVCTVGFLTETRTANPTGGRGTTDGPGPPTPIPNWEHVLQTKPRREAFLTENSSSQRTVASFILKLCWKCLCFLHKLHIWPYWAVC